MMKIFAVLIYLGVCVLLANASSPENLASEDTLELVHVVFRHGDRTPDPAGLYPNDPYINVTYYPVGWGQLINEGKVRAYNLGVALKEKYGRFLGDIYTPSLISPTTSYYPRCKASLELVLAGLFPPTGIQVWNAELNWQPIPITNLPATEDFLFWAYTNCPNYGELEAENQRNFEESSIRRLYAGVISYLAEKSGLEANNSFIAGGIYSTLLSEQAWGYKLPAWTDSVWPEPISTLTAYGWEVMVGGKKLSTLLGGFLFSKIINDTYSKIDNVEGAKDVKIYLYSGHDLTVATVLSWLEVFEPQQPPYSSYVTIEVHNINGIRALKIFFQNYSTPDPQQIWIPNCGPLCPLDQFVEIYGSKFNATEICGI